MAGQVSTSNRAEFCFPLLLAVGLTRCNSHHLRLEEWEEGLKTLYARQKEVVVLKVLFGLQYDEIAPIYGTSNQRVQQVWEGAVYRLHKSGFLDRIKDCLRDD